MRDAPLVWSARVPADPTSPRRCRLAATDLLDRAGADHLVPDAALLVSELVTNVLLHARTDASVRLSVRSGTLLVEVEDDSPVIPRPQDPAQSSPTGRGLALVEGLSNAWGAVPNGEGGKVIWFELGTRTHTRSTPEPLPDHTGHVVTLVDAPLMLALRTLEHGDAMIRELELATVATAATPSVGAPGHREAPVDVGPLRRALEHAAAEGQSSATIEVSFDDAAASGVLNRLAQIDEGDRIGNEGGTLAAPSLPEVALCRTWLLTEVAWQLKGAEPTPWRLPSPIDLRGDWDPVSAEDARAAAATPGAVVLADARNRILHLNHDAEQLLGWSSAELAGHRLTLLIPPSFREAHLASFTHHQVTGERHIIGTEVQVPALTRSGSEVSVLLTVEEVVLSSGIAAYRGTLRNPPTD